MDDNLLDNEILTINFNKKLVSYSNTVDKRFITLLAQGISKQGTGKIKIKEIVDFLKVIPGRYDQDQVLHDMAQ